MRSQIRPNAIVVLCASCMLMYRTAIGRKDQPLNGRIMLISANFLLANGPSFKVFEGDREIKRYLTNLICNNFVEPLDGECL